MASVGDINKSDGGYKDLEEVEDQEAKTKGKRRRKNKGEKV